MLPVVPFQAREAQAFPRGPLSLQIKLQGAAASARVYPKAEAVETSDLIIDRRANWEREMIGNS